MFNLEINDEDINWLHERYPDLALSPENGIQIISGEFHFDAIFDGIRIKDRYEIKIKMQGNYHSDLPNVRETASRIINVAKSKGIPLADLHTYEDGSTCLCIKLAETDYFPNGFIFQKFIEGLVVDFFYAQSYFEKFGKWPWEYYSHGILGWLEWYSDIKERTPETAKEFLRKLKSTREWRKILNELNLNTGIKGHQPCICGSTKKYRNCHKKVFWGLWKFQQDIKKYGLKIE